MWRCAWTCVEYEEFWQLYPSRCAINHVSQSRLPLPPSLPNSFPSLPLSLTVELWNYSRLQTDYFWWCQWLSLLSKLCLAITWGELGYSRDWLDYCCSHHAVSLQPGGVHWTQQPGGDVCVTKCAAVTSINLRSSLTNCLLNVIHGRQAELCYKQNHSDWCGSR